jgi:hypothetical protein
VLLILLKMRHPQAVPAQRAEIERIRKLLEERPCER